MNVWDLCLGNILAVLKIYPHSKNSILQAFRKDLLEI